MDQAADDGDGALALHARVSSWESRILPLLAEQEQRRQFDIAVYSQELLDRMPAAEPPAAPPPSAAGRKRAEPEGGAAGRAVPFAELMSGQERHEVCRMFLAALQLANNRNLDVLDE